MDAINGFLTSSSFRYMLSSASYSRINPRFTAGKQSGVLKLSSNSRTPENDHLHICSLVSPDRGSGNIVLAEKRWGDAEGILHIDSVENEHYDGI
jgi:hypothetical protein